MSSRLFGATSLSSLGTDENCIAPNPMLLARDQLLSMSGLGDRHESCGIELLRMFEAVCGAALLMCWNHLFQRMLQVLASLWCFHFSHVKSN